MIDIAALAVGALAAVLPYLAKGGEEIAKGAGADLWKWIESKLSQKGKEKNITDLEASPNDPRIRGKVEENLHDLLQDDDSLINELEALVNAARANILDQSGDSTTNVSGTGHIVIERTTGTTISIKTGTRKDGTEKTT